eukprot:961765-Pyramimonas_sp.AAC.1
MQDSRKQYGQWLTQSDKHNGSLHKITKPPPRRETEIHTGTTVTKPEGHDRPQDQDTHQTMDM